MQMCICLCVSQKQKDSEDCAIVVKFHTCTPIADIGEDINVTLQKLNWVRVQVLRSSFGGQHFG